MANDKNDKKNEKEKKRRAGRLGKFDYFAAFEAQGDFILNEAHLLADTLKNYESAESLEPVLAQAHEIEAQADRECNHILEALQDEFLAPLDRIDIAELAQELDEVVDWLERIIRHFYMYDIDDIMPEAQKMCDLLVRECETLREALDYFRELRKPKRMKALAHEVVALEDECDDVYLHAMHDLFTTDTDYDDLVRWRAVYNAFQATAHATRRTTKLMKRIIVKNS